METTFDEVESLKSRIETLESEKARLQEIIDQKNSQMREVHNELVWASQEIMWATDGTLDCAKRHIMHLVHNRTVERDDARRFAEALQISIPDVLSEYFNGGSFDRVRADIINSIHQKAKHNFGK